MIRLLTARLLLVVFLFLAGLAITGSVSPAPVIAKTAPTQFQFTTLHGDGDGCMYQKNYQKESAPLIASVSTD
ncbi:hypothetical protein KFU94_24725 [Chloroflexi bacterium TSY]|nr:hypothetical protein [Chloroflexi bacterium TSY]